VKVGVHMNLKEKVKNLTSSPGVYLMKDSLGSIIYVGKAKNLKKRVQSYFQNSKSHPSKVKKLVKNLKDFEYIVTDTEFEAFMLECKLIKELKPIYNKKMKNPLSYTYVVIQMDEEYPSIEITNSPVENDCNLYFGPYTSKNTVEKALQGMKEYFKILCSNTSKKNTECLNYSLGLCIGMCLGGAAVEEYHNIINKIIALFNGTDMSVLKEMKQRMLYASEKFDFETAAKYRDYIDAISFLINKEKVIEFTKDNKNIAVIEHLSNCTIKLFLIKGNKVLFSEKYILEKANIEYLSTIIKTNILTCFKAKTLNSSIEVI
jgi:excinuclease ABC subunit C